LHDALPIEIVVFRDIGGQKKQGRCVEDLGRKKESLYVDGRPVDRDGKNDIRILQEEIFLVAKAYFEGLILVTVLVVITFLPENADSDKILLEFVGATQVRSREKAEASRVYFQRLVDGKLHRKIGGGSAVLPVELIRKKFFGFDHSFL